MSNYKVEVISAHVCELGEGPHWDQKSQSLYYVDLTAGDVCRLNPESRESEILAHIGGIVSLVIPIDNDKNELIITQDNKIYKLDVNSKQKELLVEAEQNLPGNRFNDGKCDSSGRLWVGSMGPEKPNLVFTPNRGSYNYLHNFIILDDILIKLMNLFSGALYSFQSSRLEKRFEVVDLSNGLAWSLDNTQMYFIDSVKRFVYSFDFDLNTGTIGQ